MVGEARGAALSGGSPRRPAAGTGPRATPGKIATRQRGEVASSLMWCESGDGGETLAEEQRYGDWQDCDEAPAPKMPKTTTTKLDRLHTAASMNHGIRVCCVNLRHPTSLLRKFAPRLTAVCRNWIDRQ